MRMNMSQFEDDEDDAVNLTPMLDVVFIMLIFFIVTASFVKESGIDVNRPNAATAERKEKGNILVAISEVELKLQRGLLIIKSLVALCPMLGLIGTVTGMIEVFDVMAIAGTGHIRGMAGGISKATLPTMAGMVAALSGLIFSAQLERFAKSARQRVADRLELGHE